MKDEPSVVTLVVCSFPCKHFAITAQSKLTPVGCSIWELEITIEMRIPPTISLLIFQQIYISMMLIHNLKLLSTCPKEVTKT